MSPPRVIPRASGTHPAKPGLIVDAGPAGRLWVPLHEALALADTLVDTVEALQANARAAHAAERYGLGGQP